MLKINYIQIKELIYQYVILIYNFILYVQYNKFILIYYIYFKKFKKKFNRLTQKLIKKIYIYFILLQYLY